MTTCTAPVLQPRGAFLVLPPHFLPNVAGRVKNWLKSGAPPATTFEDSGPRSPRAVAGVRLRSARPSRSRRRSVRPASGVQRGGERPLDAAAELPVGDGGEVGEEPLPAA